MKGKRSMKVESKLKPCPFCGSKNVKQAITYLKPVPEIFCNECGVEVRCVYDDVRIAWNRRNEEVKWRKEMLK